MIIIIQCYCVWFTQIIIYRLHEYRHIIETLTPVIFNTFFFLNRFNRIGTIIHQYVSIVCYNCILCDSYTQNQNSLDKRKKLFELRFWHAHLIAADIDAEVFCF